MHAHSRSVPRRSAVRSATFVELFHGYQRELVQAGYKQHVARLHHRSIVHFGVWLELERIDPETINEQTVATFERHRSRCRCPGTSRDRGRHVVSCVRVFVRHLREQGSVAPEDAPPEPFPLVREFLEWMRADRGVVEATLTSYRLYVTNLLDFLGDDPRTYSASGLRDFIAKRYRHYGRNSIRMVLAAVRMFLRYLAVEGRCRPGLEQALPSPANWSQQSLPRGLTSQEIERVLTLCPSTRTGIRDRAILLLLARLGLRAGDVAALRFSDLCFQTATLRVSGKGGREVRLPLPQDVGDALLDYLRVGRPSAPSDHVFLRAMAPFKPFGGSRPGHAVTHVARTALKRADVQRPTRGAHVFRHTAACQMLRADVGLEGIAQVLRHRSIETSALYAKVDLQLLGQVAQPWPEAAPC
ncbi:MAG: tyrosine-type recombinase/integrase [Gemmatimonas sp.]|nr:tyrosine-type recombinase/integrase [Gemmatimonas sp.]